jgi:hypothetical protein
MGCNRSAIIATEVETLRNQVKLSEQDGRNSSIQISELQREIEKAKQDAMTLLEENQKLTYQLHCRRNEEDCKQILNSEFESNKEEFMKVKLWSEFEIQHANQVLESLLANSDLSEKDERRVRISFLLPQIMSSQYDMEHLLVLAEQRYEHIQYLLTALFKFKDTLKIQIKALDHMIISALKQVEKPEAAEHITAISSADSLSKLHLIRKAIKTFGLGDASGPVPDVWKEMELEGEIVNLKARCNYLEDEVRRLQSIIEDMQRQTSFGEEQDMETPDIESVAPTPAPVVESTTAPSRAFKRRMTSFNVSSMRVNDLESLHDHISPEIYALGLELKRTQDTLRAYEENMPEIRASARLVREKGSKEAVLKLLVWIEALVEAIKAVGVPANQYIL